MLTKHKVYYTIEVRSEEEDIYNFICSFSTFSEAVDKVTKLKEETGLEYRILKVEKDIEEVS